MAVNNYFHYPAEICQHIVSYLPAMEDVNVCFQISKHWNNALKEIKLPVVTYVKYSKKHFQSLEKSNMAHKIEKLYVSRLTLANKYFRQALELMKNLNSLTIFGKIPWFTPNIFYYNRFKRLRNFPNITNLSITDNNFREIEVISSMPSISTLKIENGRFFRAISGMHNLTDLSVCKCNLDNAGMKCISEMKSLKRLDVRGNAFCYFAKGKCLRDMKLEYLAVFDVE